MMKITFKLVMSFLLGFRRTSGLALENFALRQQLAIMKRSGHRPRIRCRDRLFWVLLSRIWKNWREAVIVVKPATVLR